MAAPGDSVVVERRWLRINRDGSPDRRFKWNHEVPVVRCGILGLDLSGTGMKLLTSSPGAPGSALTCSNQRSRNSRAAATSLGSFFTFCLGSRLAFVICDVLSATGSPLTNRNPPLVISFRLTAGASFICFLRDDFPGSANSVF